MKKTNQTFAFRQRIGQVNWKQISSINIEDIIQNLKVNELQALLDNVTFSEITLQDLKQNSIQSIQILLHINQLIIEYLLFHQEEQYATIHSLQRKVAHVKTQRDSFQQQTITYQEDIKTYKRQLHILRKALQSGKKDDSSAEEKHGARIIYPRPNDTTDNHETTRDLIKTLVEHETDARKMMSSLLEEQRRAFNHEIVTILDSIRQQGSFNNNNNSSSQQMMQSFQLLMENMKLQFQQTLQSTVTSSPPRTSQTAETLKAAALQALKEDLDRKERELIRREEQLQRQSDQREGLFTAQRKYVMQEKYTACSTIFLLLQSALKRKKLRTFHHWHTFTLQHRHEEYDEEQRKHLLYASSQPSSREVELQRLYDDEREKSIILQAKLNTYQRELETYKQRLEDTSASKQKESQREQELQSQIKQLQEKSIVLSAKLNTGTSRHEKEKQDLLTKIQILEKMIADVDSNKKNNPGPFSSPPRKIYYDTATNISKDFASGLMSSLELPKKIFPKHEVAVGDSLAFDYNDQMNEYDLLENAMARISSRNNKQTVEQLAIATLTQEFMTKLQH